MDALIDKDSVPFSVVDSDNTDPVGFLPEGSEALSKYIEEDLKNEFDSDEDFNSSSTTEGKHYCEKLFLKAAEKGKEDLVIKMLQKDGTLIFCKDSDGYTALHRSSYNGHVEIVKTLLKNGADIASKTENNWEALHCACRWGKARICLQSKREQLDTL